MPTGFAVNFEKVILAQLKTDMDELTGVLSTHIDENIIDRKFQGGFPGHKLAKRTIRKKGHERVGEDTGALRRAATSWKSWAMHPFEAGTVRKQLEKKKHKLTHYASALSTKIGGKVDFLELTAEDAVNMQGFVRGFLRSRKYAGDGSIKVIRQ